MRTTTVLAIEDLQRVRGGCGKKQQAPTPPPRPSSAAASPQPAADDAPLVNVSVAHGLPPSGTSAAT